MVFKQEKVSSEDFDEPKSRSIQDINEEQDDITINKELGKNNLTFVESNVSMTVF